MEEADYLCDRVAIIDEGVIRAVDSPEKLKKYVGSDIISLRLKDETGSYLKKLKELGYEDVITSDGEVVIHVPEVEKKIPEILRIAFESGYEIEEVRIRRPTLEDVFIKLTGYKELPGCRKERISRIITARRLR